MRRITDEGVDRANYDETGINTTSAVGCFPGGASPYGVEEMAGNVWEWTRSLWGNYPYPTDKQGRARRENLKAPETAPRVRRGGAFWLSHRDVRCACRLRDLPDIRLRPVGFRVVVLPCL